MGLQIVQGTANTAALIVPGLTVGIQAPSITTLNGTPFNIAGFVGTASYGPVDTPVSSQDYGTFSAACGPLVNRAFDLGTAITVARQQGCTNFQTVRVTDGTDTAASAQFGTVSANYAAMLTAKYTGTAGNAFKVTILASSYPASVRVMLTNGLQAPEFFDGITNASPAAFWASLVHAINNGTNASRPASQYFIATAGTLTTTAIPAVNTSLALSGGTDGVADVVTATLVGVDGNANTRTGMYALRGTGVSWAGLVDCSDDASWTSQQAFAQSAQCYMVTCGPSGSTIAGAVTTGTNGAAGYGLKIMFGDWLTFLDTVNNIQRTISPIAFVVGLGASQLPNQSTLNKPIYGVIGSQFAASNLIYTNTDLTELIQAGYDVVTPPGQGPGGLPIWCCSTGINSNFNPAANTDNYTTMTNFLATSVAQVGGLAQFLGAVLTMQVVNEQKAVLDTWMQGLQDQGLIGNAEGTQAFQNTIASTPAQLALGITIINSQVQYLSINSFIVVNLLGGQTVSINTAPSANQ
jgi:hypothetical protein